MPKARVATDGSDASVRELATAEADAILEQRGCTLRTTRSIEVQQLEGATGRAPVSRAGDVDTMRGTTGCANVCGHWSAWNR